MDTLLKTIQSTIIKQGGCQNVYHLNLQKIQCPIISFQAKQLIQKCHNIYQINLKECGLRSLNNLPNVDLTTLDLPENQLVDQQIHKLSIYPNLAQVTLQKNKICLLKSFQFIKNLPQLQQIDLKGNPLCKDPLYYKKLFEISEKYENLNLKIIDCYRKNGQIISDQENNDQQLMDQQWMDRQSESESQNLSQGGLFTDPIDNCLDQQENDLQINDMEEEIACQDIKGHKKMKY